MLRKSIVFLLLILCIFLFSGAGYGVGQGTDEVSYQIFLLKEAALPQLPQSPDLNALYSGDGNAMAQYDAWWAAKIERQEIDIPDMALLQEFTLESTQRLSEDRRTPNFLYSPVSLWLCLHTLADLSGGDSRAQLLEALGQPDDAARQAQLDAVFRSLYWEEDASVCVPATAVWLDEGTGLSDALLERLAAAHSSTFRGAMGGAAYDAALQAWLNEQTRGLLKDSVSDLRFSAENGLALSSTLYLKCGWSKSFDKDATAPDVFYTASGEVTTDFMHARGYGAVYRGAGFSAAASELLDGGRVVFLLPDAGERPEELLDREEACRILFSGGDWDGAQRGMVKFSMPKVDFRTDLPLQDALASMGITDIFDPQRAQFSPELTSDTPLSLSALRQYARLIMNEDGVEAAAITMTFDIASPLRPGEEFDFTLNRPFLFAVMSEKNIPLFIGTYCTPEGVHA